MKQQALEKGLNNLTEIARPVAKNRVQSAHMLMGRQLNDKKQEVYMQNQQVERLERELQSLNEQNDLRRKQREEIETQKAARNRPRKKEEQDANLPDYNENG